MNINSLHPLILLVILLLLTGIRFGYEKAISKGFKAFKIEQTGRQIVIRSILLIMFNILLLFAFGLLSTDIFSTSEAGTGLIFIAIGFGVALLIGFLTFMALKAGFGGDYKSLVATSKLDKSLTILNFILLVGPAEDLFFLGLIQHVLTFSLGWGAILIYLLLFILYHYANVLSGFETKQEFFGALPVRLMASTLLSLSFYFTSSLLYGLIIHNTIDTISYLTLLVFTRSISKQENPA